MGASEEVAPTSANTAPGGGMFILAVLSGAHGDRTHDREIAQEAKAE